jgi:hypothetical protein
MYKLQVEKTQSNQQLRTRVVQYQEQQGLASLLKHDLHKKQIYHSSGGMIAAT